MTTYMLDFLKKLSASVVAPKSYNPFFNTESHFRDLKESEFVYLIILFVHLEISSSPVNMISYMYCDFS